MTFRCLSPAHTHVANTWRPLCDKYEKQKSRTGCKGHKKVLLKLSTGRLSVAEYMYLQLESVVSCLLNMHKRQAVTDFGRDEVSVVARRSPTSHQMIGDKNKRAT